ncbi:MAG: hypothetical protein JXB88_26960 [Spirochaetales bacterium]|nr:hypothetical protein [Spirochaetales bacterium]
MKKERVIIISLFLFAFIIRIIYFSHTDPYTRTDDIYGHLDYIEFIAEKTSFPAISDLEQSYHPPFYYFISAMFRKLLSLFRFLDDMINRALQFLSLCFHMGFLIAGTLVIKRYISNKSILYLCISLFYFWPSSILHSARIGNDNLFYCFYGLGFLFLCKWYDEEKTIDIFYFTLFTLLCIFTKANGIVIPGCFGILVLIKFFQAKSKRKFVISVLPSIVLLFLGVAGLFAFPVMDSLHGYEVITFANRTYSMGWGPTLGVEANNYLYFDVKDYLNEPFVDMFADTGGRQYFWNYLCKTSLFGEFTVENAFLRNCAIIMSFLLFIIAFVMIAGIVMITPCNAKKRLPFIFNLFLLVFSSAVFRFLSPMACSNDFRYIFPVIITFPVFLNSAIAFLNEKRLFLFCYSIYGIILMFTAFSIIFYISWL